MPLSLLEQLIRCRSITPADDGCQELIAKTLAPFGFSAEHFPCEGVSNVWLRRGQKAPLLVFAGHTDVVPIGDESAWDSPAFEPTRKGDLLYGRGAADMKGGLAAMIHACQSFVQKHPQHPGSIAFLLTSDEEGPAIHGTRHVVQKLAKRETTFDWCVLGEPSSDKKMGDTIRYGRRGSLSAKLCVRGKQGHVAYPDKTNNPIHAAAAVIAELSEICWDAGNEHFSPSSFQCYRVHSDANASNIVPATMTIEFNIRFSPESTVESIKQRIEAVCKRKKLDSELIWNLSAQPFLTEPGVLIQKAQQSIKQITRQPTTLSTGGGTSDGRYITEICPELIELGPINASIHQVNEHVSISDLKTLSNIYEKLTEALLLKA